MGDRYRKIGPVVMTNPISADMSSFSTTGRFPTDIPQLTTIPTLSVPTLSVPTLSSPSIISLPAITPTSTAGDDATTVLVTATATPTLVPIPTAAGPASAPLDKIAIIIGSTIGVAVFLISVALALWFFQRRRRGYATKSNRIPHTDDRVKSVNIIGPVVQRTPSRYSREMQQRIDPEQEQGVYGEIFHSRDAHHSQEELLDDGEDHQQQSVPESWDIRSSWTTRRSNYAALDSRGVAQNDCYDDSEAQPQTQARADLLRCDFVSPAESAPHGLTRGSGTTRTVSTVSSFGERGVGRGI